MRFAVKSDKGMVREINEDSYNIIAGYPGIPVTFIVADGMGGHNSGEIASKMAVDLVSNYILQSESMLLQGVDMEKVIKDIVQKANGVVYAKSKENETNFGMGTTLIIAVIYNKKMIIGHIGDSRVYIIRKGVIEQITTDHSLIEELVINGSITREEAKNHPKKNVITRAIGCYEEVEVDLYHLDIKEDDIFILCTDGLSNMLSDEEIKNTVDSNDNPELVCDELVRLANEKGGEDNITVLLCRTT